MKEMVGKWVTVLVPEHRDDKGKRTGKNIEISGICNYYGPNEILNKDLIIILSRCPIDLKNSTQIISVK